jgi:phosphotransferase system enzyme I (PtsI)
MAGDPLCCPILLGMQLDELSMNHLAIPRIKRILQQSKLEESRRLLTQALSYNSAAEVRAYVQDYMIHHFPDEFQKREM